MHRRSSPQDVTWFLDLRRNAQIDLDPPYQRRSVWNKKDKQFFLDTVLRGYPCPPIFLHKTQGRNQQAVYAVVDGKQRLQTLFQFVENEISLSLDFNDDRRDGKLWNELSSEDKQAFWDYVIPVEFLTFNPDEQQMVNQAFDRLNRNMRKLEPQELRHARWDGWFIKLVEKECDEPFWREIGVVTNARSKRMKDAQFISELLLVIINKQQSGFSQELIDDAYAKYDDLEETDNILDPDEIIDLVERTKRFLSEANKKNGCVRDSAKTVATMYTLWSFVSLHINHLGEPDVFAQKYADFIRMVSELKSRNITVSGETELQNSRYKEASNFAKALQGASTDLGPRSRRLSALLAEFSIALQ